MQKCWGEKYFVQCQTGSMSVGNNWKWSKDTLKFYIFTIKWLSPVALKKAWKSLCFVFHKLTAVSLNSWWVWIQIVTRSQQSKLFKALLQKIHFCILSVIQNMVIYSAFILPAALIEALTHILENKLCLLTQYIHVAEVVWQFSMVVKSRDQWSLLKVPTATFTMKRKMDFFQPPCMQLTR